ncbi:hypothetical protein J3E71DRAFT_241156 [Bipolaris maydis]|nr:hypothetical protein J3E71DRAFT_241156 [Bipolaris maydis]
MVRTASEKDTLRKYALEQIMERTGVQLANEETSGENDFKHAKFPDVCGVVVDKGSGQGWVQIQGGKKATTKINTGPEEVVQQKEGKENFPLVEILDGQTWSKCAGLGLEKREWKSPLVKLNDFVNSFWMILAAPPVKQRSKSVLMTSVRSQRSDASRDAVSPSDARYNDASNPGYISQQGKGKSVRWQGASGHGSPKSLIVQ